MSNAPQLDATEISTVETVIQEARRRRLLVLAVEHSATALAIVFAGFALLTLLGTQILSWPWLLLILFVGLSLSLFGVHRQLVDTYTLAQMVDQRLNLKDSLSTAWFIRRQASPLEQTAAAFQLRSAEEIARSTNLSAAFPFQRQRSWMITAALALLAAGLFSARYLVTRELSLQHSFLPLTVTQVFEYMRHSGTNIGSSEKSPDTSRSKSLPPGVLGQEAERQRAARKQEQRPVLSGQQGTKGGVNSQGDPSGEQSGDHAGSRAGQNDDSKRAGGEGTNSGSKADSGTPSGKEDRQPDAEQQDGADRQKTASMMNRMRDAMSSVMAKIKPSGVQKDNQSGTQKSSDGQKGADKTSSKDQNAEGQKDSGKEQSAQEQSSGQQPSQGAAKAQSSGKDSAQASDRKGSDAQSGVGHSNGDKDVKAAEQVTAMGKLAEIIGKRSASLTGEMRVEPSGKQRLQTGYTHQQGQHSDLGGEINRDEVPIQDQQYVREYMELVRKNVGRSITPN